MPHLTLQYTANIEGFDSHQALREINQRLADSGHFDEVAIKSRAVRLDDYRIGVADTGRAFLHAQLKVLPGRDAATRRALARRARHLAARLAVPPSRYPALRRGRRTRCRHLLQTRVRRDH